MADLHTQSVIVARKEVVEFLEANKDRPLFGDDEPEFIRRQGRNLCGPRITNPSGMCLICGAPTDHMTCSPEHKKILRKKKARAAARGRAMEKAGKSKVIKWDMKGL
jgi:hypothetical protein